jgi:DNA glycosylase AlkZ-like
MLTDELINLRLHNQRLSSEPLKSPVEVVKWFGAVQAQDYYAAKWALAQRSKDATDEIVEDAFSRGSILRTHVLRPTWHFVAAADIRWLLALTAPRVQRTNAYYYRQAELDSATLKRGTTTMAKALRGGNNLTRESLRDAINRAGIKADGLRLNYLLIHAELNAVICSGPRKGKQFTYALLEERVPPAKPKSREDSLAELVWRYFRSHGPATIQDFVWWSSLTTSDVRKGLEMNRHRLIAEKCEDQTYWMASSKAPKEAPCVIRLLPTYDEYLVAYKDRKAALPFPQLATRNPVFNAPIVINGRVIGGWKRVLNSNDVIVSLTPFKPLSRAEKHSLIEVANLYGRYLGLSTVVS